MGNARAAVGRRGGAALLEGNLLGAVSRACRLCPPLSAFMRLAVSSILVINRQNNLQHSHRLFFPISHIYAFHIIRVVHFDLCTLL